MEVEHVVVVVDVGQSNERAHELNERLATKYWIYYCGAQTQVNIPTSTEPKYLPRVTYTADDAILGV